MQQNAFIFGKSNTSNRNSSRQYSNSPSPKKYLDNKEQNNNILYSNINNNQNNASQLQQNSQNAAQKKPVFRIKHKSPISNTINNSNNISNSNKVINSSNMNIPFSSRSQLLDQQDLRNHKNNLNFTQIPINIDNHLNQQPSPIKLISEQAILIRNRNIEISRQNLANKLGSQTSRVNNELSFNQSSIQDMNQMHKSLIENVISRSAVRKKRNSTQAIDTLLSQQSNISSNNQQQSHHNNSEKQYLQNDVGQCQIFQQQQQKQHMQQQTLFQNNQILLNKHKQNDQEVNFQQQSQISKNLNQNISPIKQSNNGEMNIREIELMRDERYPMYQDYKDKQQILENRYKEFFVLNKNFSEKSHINTQHQKNLEQSQFINDVHHNMSYQQTQQQQIGKFNRNKVNNKLALSTMRREISTSQVKMRQKDMFNQIQLANGNRTGKSTDRNHMMRLKNKSQLSHRNIRFFENLINANNQTQKLLNEFESNQDIVDIIQDQGHFFYFHQETQKTLEKQLIRLSKFSVDFQLTQKTISDCIANFFIITDKQLRSAAQQQLDIDSSFGSSDSYQLRKLRQKLLDQRQQQFERLKKKVDGLTYPLQSYSKDIIRGTLSIKQEEQLKKRSGLIEFISELNDCEKNLLRLMQEISHENCFPMYALDFHWKMLLVRIEYHLDDEEQRLQKVQKYFDSQLKKEIAEVQYSIQNKEEHYKEVIAKLERQRELQQSRIDKLMADKGELLDAIRDKEDELQLLRNTHNIGKVNNYKNELETYMSTLKTQIMDQNNNSIYKESSHKDGFTLQKQLSLISDIKPTQLPQYQPILIQNESMQTNQFNKVIEEGSSSENEDDAHTMGKQNNQFADMLKQQHTNSDIYEIMSHSQHGGNYLNIQDNKSQTLLKQQQQQQQQQQHQIQQQQHQPQLTQEQRKQLKLEQKLEDIQLIKMNKSKGLPNYKVIDEGYMASQISQIQNQTYISATKEKSQLYQITSQSQTSMKISRTKDEYIQTDVDDDFICSKCLLRANNEEHEYQYQQLLKQQQEQLQKQSISSQDKNDNNINNNNNNNINSNKNKDVNVSKINSKTVGFDFDQNKSRQTQLSRNQSNKTDQPDEIQQEISEQQKLLDQQLLGSQLDTNQKRSRQNTNTNMQIPKRNTNQREETQKLTKLIEKQQKIQKSRTKSMLKANAFLNQGINTNMILGGVNNGVGGNSRSHGHGGFSFNSKRNSNTAFNNRMMMLNENMSSRLTLADQLNHESKEIIIMPEQTLIKQIEELLEKKFENEERMLLIIKQCMILPQSNSSVTGLSISTPLISSQALIAYQNSNSQQDLLQFAFTHFLTLQGLKSLALRYLNSLYSGLRKIYLKNPQENQYAQFLIQIFGFNPSEFPAFRPDQTKVALKVRHLFQLVQKHQQENQNKKQNSQQQSQQYRLMNRTRLTDGGMIKFLEFIPFLFKACRNTPKGVFSSVINKLELQELSFKDSLPSQQVQRHFVMMKILLLISYSRIDLATLALKTEERELQMDVVIMHMQEILEIKITKNETQIFKKEFQNFYLVPLKQLEQKIQYYTQIQDKNSKLAQDSKLVNPDFQISLLVLMNRILEEWEHYQAFQKKKLLKMFIDYDENGDGVLTLNEFRELMKNLEGSAGVAMGSMSGTIGGNNTTTSASNNNSTPTGGISNERIVMLFKEAVEMSNELEQMNMQNTDNVNMDNDNNTFSNTGGTGNLQAVIGASDRISPECFVETVVKHRLGGYGNEFLDFEFLNQQLALQQQKDKEQQEKDKDKNVKDQ